MSLDKFDYILALAEERNLTRAAKKTFISQPALTNYINKLENQLGVKLFDRTVTPIQITLAGSIYIQRMKKIQLAESNLLNELKSLSMSDTVFHFGIGSTRGSHWLPYLIPAFYEKFPHVTLRLHELGESSLEDGVRRGEIDLAFGALNTGYQELTYEKLGEEQILLAVPRSFAPVKDLPSHAATVEEPYLIPSACVTGMPFLLPYPGNGFYRCAQAMLNQAQVTPGRVLSYTNMNTAYQLCGSGVGALFITPGLFDSFKPELKQHIAFCTLQEPVYTRNAVAAYQKNNPQMGMIRTLIDLATSLLPPLRAEQNSTAAEEHL